MPSKKHPAIRFVDVSFYRVGRKPILKDINISIPQGLTTAIIGPNGGGKTTFINLTLGLLKPTTGNIIRQGNKKITHFNKVAYIFQNQKNINKSFPITIQEIVMMGLHGSSLQKKEKQLLVEKEMQDFGISELASERLFNLSGGEIQRVLLARAWASDADIFFLDEPTSFLDPAGEQIFYKKLANLQERKKTTLIVSHDIGAIPRIAKNVFCINQTAHSISKEINEEKIKKTLKNMYPSNHILFSTHTHKK